MENKRYKDLKVTAGTYVPPEKMDYPEDDPYVGLYKPVYDRDFPAVDASYPYFDMSLRTRILHFLAYHIILRILGWILRFKYGLRWQIEGEEKWHRSSCGVRRWLKQFDLSRGAITIANRGEEDRVLVGTCNTIPRNAFLRSPRPAALCKQFHDFLIAWHAPACSHIDGSCIILSRENGQSIALVVAHHFTLGPIAQLVILPRVGLLWLCLAPSIVTSSLLRACSTQVGSRPADT